VLIEFSVALAGGGHGLNEFMRVARLPQQGAPPGIPLSAYGFVYLCTARREDIPGQRRARPLRSQVSQSVRSARGEMTVADKRVEKNSLKDVVGTALEKNREAGALSDPARGAVLFVPFSSCTTIKFLKFRQLS
jgi:hypothetical protein